MLLCRCSWGAVTKFEELRRSDQSARVPCLQMLRERSSVPHFYVCVDSSPAYEALFLALGKTPSLSSDSARTPAQAALHSPGADHHSPLQNSIHSCINCSTLPELMKEWACPDGYGTNVVSSRLFARITITEAEIKKRQARCDTTERTQYGCYTPSRTASIQPLLVTSLPPSFDLKPCQRTRGRGYGVRLCQLFDPWRPSDIHGPPPANWRSPGSHVQTLQLPSPDGHNRMQRPGSIRPRVGCQHLQSDLVCTESPNSSGRVSTLPLRSC